jgi:outer membrane protein TolC
MVRFVVLCALLAVPPAAWCQESAPSVAEVLTLEQAVSLALQNNRLVKVAALEVDKSEDRIAATRTYQWPVFDFKLFEAQLLTTLDFEFRQGVFGVIPTPVGAIPTPPQDTLVRTGRVLSTFGLTSVSQPLSQLYRIGLGVRATEIGRDIAQEKLRSQRQSVANDVKRVYYGILQVQSGLEAINEALKLYRELDGLVERYVVQQVALKADSLDVKTRLAKTEVEEFTLRNSLATLKEQLNELLARDIRTDFSVAPAPGSAQFEVELISAQARALNQRPEVKEARLKMKQAEFDRRMKKAEYIPDVSLTFNYLSLVNVEVLPTHVAGVGVVVSWNPFDWGRKKRELAEKTKTLEQADNGIKETEAFVLIDVNTKFRKLQESRAMLRVSQLAQETAREKLRVATNKYTQQAVLLKDVLQTQAQLAEANQQYQQALLNFWTARAEFEKALGEE